MEFFGYLFIGFIIPMIIRFLMFFSDFIFRYIEMVINFTEKGLEKHKNIFIKIGIFFLLFLSCFAGIALTINFFKGRDAILELNTLAMTIGLFLFALLGVFDSSWMKNIKNPHQNKSDEFF